MECTPTNGMASIHAVSASKIDRRGLYIDVGDQIVDQSCAHRAVAQWVDPPCTVARRVTEAMRFGTPASTVMAILGVVHDP